MSNHIYLKVPYCRECKIYAPDEDEDRTFPRGWCWAVRDGEFVDPDDFCIGIKDVPWEWIEGKEDEDED